MSGASPQPGRRTTCLEDGMETAMSSSYESPDGRTSYSWAMPEYGRVDYLLCEIGAHIGTRKPVVTGFVGWFSSIERWYCACGRRCWIKYEGGWADSETTEPGAHLHWIDGKVEMDNRMALHHSWERAMSEQHPCWGSSDSCISCGCTESMPCVSHKGRPQPTFDHTRMAAARVRQEKLRAVMWPDHGNT